MKFVRKTAMSIAFLSGALFLAACDDSGSAISAEDTPKKHSDVDEPGLESSESLIRSSSSVAMSSSVRILEDFFDDQRSSSSFAKGKSSSSVESSVQECYKSGMASIMLVSVENINFNCPSGMTMYDSDSWTFYKCDGSTLVKKVMPPCSNNNVESSDSRSSSSSRKSVNTDESKVMPSGTYDCTKYSCFPTENLNQEMLAAGTYGEILDKRDNQVYKTIKIGEQVWMAQNLNYADSVATPSLLGGNWCFDNDEANCRATGRLYTWVAAADSLGQMAEPFDPSICEYVNGVCDYPGRNQGICPPGWRLPDTTDLGVLSRYVHDNQAPLRTSLGWKNSPEATNESGFSAIPVGGYTENTYHCRRGKCFACTGEWAAFWSVSQSAVRDMATAMVIDTLDHSLVYKTAIQKESGLSVRCVRDLP